MANNMNWMQKQGNTQGNQQQQYGNQSFGSQGGMNQTPPTPWGQQAQQAQQSQQPFQQYGMGNPNDQNPMNVYSSGQQGGQYGGPPTQNWGYGTVNPYPIPGMQTLDYNKWMQGGWGKNTPVGGQDPWGNIPPAIKDWQSWVNDDNRGAFKSYLENWGFPMAQLQQNDQQRRYQQYMDMQNYNMTLGMNQFNMGQQQHQNQFQKWLADEQNKQFQQTFGLDKDVAGWRYGPNGIEQTKNVNDRFGIEQETYRKMQDLQNQRRLQELIGQQEMGQLTKRGQQELEQLTKKGEDDRRLQTLMGQQQMGQLTAKGKQELEQLMKRGQQEMSQLTTRGQQEMSQLEKSLASQELQSRYQAFGRAQAPNMRWSANW